MKSEKRDIIRFVLRFFLFLMIATIGLECFATVVKMSGIYKKLWAGKEVYYSISKSKKKSSSKVLLLGDSVANQLFNQKKYNDRPYSLACVEPISLVGQYLLLNNYLKAGNEIDSLILMYHPYGFSNKLDQAYTYNYFLKPFLNSEYYSLFTNTVKERLEEIPFKFLIPSSFVLTSRWSPTYRKSELEASTFLSKISIEYLDLIKELSVEKGFKFILTPPPISFDYKEKIDKFNKEEFVGQSFENEFNDYFDNIFYVDADKFVDISHFSSQFGRTYEEMMLRKMKLVE